jgi:UDPglucose 6-dehydrogenase
LQRVMSVARDIGRAINKYTVVVDKSTVPVGTAKQVRAVVAKETKHPFAVVSNPEFLKQGAAVEDSMKPDRVVVGCDPGDEKAGEIMRELYAPFTRTGAPIMMMDTASAELSKYAANAMLATKISFMNEVANLCELVGADVDQVRKAIGADRRIGTSFLFPGVGYGGSCFPKDVKAVLKSASDRGYDFRILGAVDAVNQKQKERLVGKMQQHFGNLSGKTIALWGLAFKPRTDDMRDAPAIPIIERLLEKGAKIRAFDPAAAPVAKKIFDNRIALCERSYDALNGADALAIVTEWNEFREPDFDKMKSLLKSPVVFDGRNIYTPEQMRALGFTYFSIGR